VAIDLSELDTFVEQHNYPKPATYMRLTVNDTGHGMDARVMERIFDPYFTTKQVGEGTGLGLAVVQGIVRNHGGVITVSSQPGVGTTFQVFLPVVQCDVISSPRDEEPILTGTEHILFVDDEQSLAMLGKKMLEELGYRVKSTALSREALEIFRNDPEGFDLVITDLTMPGLSGMDLASQLTAIRPDILIMLCTGYNDMSLEEQELKTLFCDCIQKPYVMSSLAKAVRKTLDRAGGAGS
jgi:CheY-like chemotaxis protein